MDFVNVWNSAKGMPFYNIQFVKELSESTLTSSGLSIIASINTKEYPIKRLVNDEFKANLDKYILFDNNLPKWNYLIRPS
jgi:hypothetical protein